MFDEDGGKPKKGNEFPRNLELLSIDELQEYIGDLKIEIERAEKDIQKKKASIEAAAAIFKG